MVRIVHPLSVVSSHSSWHCFSRTEDNCCARGWIKASGRQRCDAEERRGIWFGVEALLTDDISTQTFCAESDLIFQGLFWPPDCSPPFDFQEKVLGARGACP